MSAARNDNQLTIDELAQRTGMTVRNIRAHQSRGLLPAPEVKGRVGYYDERHIARLELIQQLQTGGFNLTAIQRLVERAEHTGDDIGNLRSLVLAPFNDEQPEVVDVYELASQYGIEVDERLLEKAVDLGFAVPLDGRRYEVISPTLLRAGVQSLQFGVSVDTLIDVLGQIRRHGRAVADSFTKMVDDSIVRPFEEGGFDPEQYQRVREAIEALRPLAAEAMLASFKISMNDAAEDRFGKVLARVARDKRGIHGKDEAPAARTPASRRGRRRK